MRSTGQNQWPKYARGCMPCGCCAEAKVRAHRRPGPGKPPFLTKEQAEQVVAEAATGVFATAQAVRDWIEEQFGVVYTVGSMYTLLPRLGIRRQASQAQTAWKEEGSGSA